MSNQVDVSERKNRAQELRMVSKKLEAAYRQKILNLFKGKNIPVILEAVIGEKARLKTEYHFDFILSLKSIGLGKKEAEKRIGRILEIKVN